MRLNLPVVATPLHGLRVQRCVRPRLARKAQAGARTGQLPPERRIGVVCRKDGHAICRQGRDRCAVFTGDGFHAVHELLVFALGVVHQCHGRLRQRRQPGDFARMVHAQFDHTQPVRMAQTQ